MGGATEFPVSVVGTFFPGTGNSDITGILQLYRIYRFKLIRSRFLMVFFINSEIVVKSLFIRHHLLI